MRGGCDAKCRVMRRAAPSTPGALRRTRLFPFVGRGEESGSPSGPALRFVRCRARRRRLRDRRCRRRCRRRRASWRRRRRMSWRRRRSRLLRCAGQSSRGCAENSGRAERAAVRHERSRGRQVRAPKAAQQATLARSSALGLQRCATSTSLRARPRCARSAHHRAASNVQSTSTGRSYQHAKKW
jgi:hypothetical protein